MQPLRIVRAGTLVRLGPELGRGGEGAVFPVEGQHDRVAKIYSAPPDTGKVRKLMAMAEMARPALMRIAAWPIDLLSDCNGSVRGFVMPRIVARRDIHELYSPKSRAEIFPSADFTFLVHVGANIARAFAVVHEHGHVIGDVNHGNLLVGSDGTVMLIDCDSFQIGTGAHTFTCDVGVPLFTAPELHGLPLRGLHRSANHDRFALAVLLFHLLYMGRHPFAGRFLGPGEMPIEKAIADYRFAYGEHRAYSRMERPPGTIPLEAMGTTIAANFERAFSRLGATDGRPGAASWITALESLKAGLRGCSNVDRHQHPGQLGSCPWCGIEAQTGARLFGIRIATTAPTGAVDIAALWQTITGIPDPGPDPALPSERVWNPPAGVTLPSRALKTAREVFSFILAFGGLVTCNALTKEGRGVWVLVLYGLAFVVWPRVPAERRSLSERAVAAARTEWERSLARWQREAARNVFADRFTTLERVRAELVGLPNERQRRLADLQMQRESKQLLRYLDRFRIDRAAIQGIGPGRTAMLTSFGVETAADVDRAKIMQIPGFGEVLAGALSEWRRVHEQRFRFNPNEPVDQRDIDVLDRDLESRRRTLLAELHQGPNVLRLLNHEIVAARSRLMPILERAWNSYKIAEAEREAL